jgi:hypothetical protein
MDAEVSRGKSNPKSGNSGTLAQEITSRYEPTMMKLGMTPTPTPRDSKGGPSKASLSGSKGKKYGTTVPDFVKTNLLPTPQTRDWKNRTIAAGKRNHRKIDQKRMIDLNDLASMKLLPTPQTQGLKECKTEGHIH